MRRQFLVTIDIDENDIEASTAADLFRALGDDATAAAIIREHGAHDTPEEMHYTGGPE